MTEEEAIVVFTARSPQRIVREGGSQAWVLNAARAKQATWLVCTQNRHNRDHEFSDATEAHGSAFLVGKVSGVVKSAEEGDDGKQRWLVTISEYALIDVPNFWEHDRNPVRYLSRSELERKGIDFDALKFKPVLPPAVQEARAKALQGASVVQPAAAGGVVPLTIAEARNGLAAHFGVKPEAIEITIRG
ncbi:MAG: hypothetical protein JSS18_09610 [Proteobacteria bacterium]|nr:hypothetical protein [Pseudomonadota bacterium]